MAKKKKPKAKTRRKSGSSMKTGATGGGKNRGISGSSMERAAGVHDL